MGVSAAVTTGAGAEADSAGILDPLLRGENKIVEAGLDSNPAEFDGIETGVVESLPDTAKLDGAAIARSVANHVVRMAGVLEFGDVSQAEEVVLVVGEHGDARALHLDEAAFRVIHGRN